MQPKAADICQRLYSWHIAKGVTILLTGELPWRFPARLAAAARQPVPLASKCDDHEDRPDNAEDRSEWQGEADPIGELERKQSKREPDARRRAVPKQGANH